MELQFLGTGAGIPARHRNVASIALKLLQEVNSIWLFDAGEGTQMQILQTSIKPRKIEKIFITHLHGDHLFGLPGLLSSRSFQGGENALTPLEIYGPKGIRRFVEVALKTSATKINYKIVCQELSEIGGKILDNAHFKVFATPLKHGVPSFGYRIVEENHEGELQSQKLLDLGIPPGPIFGQLKRGEKVKLPDGRILNGHDFVGQARLGRIVAITGDTLKTKETVKLAKDADVLVHEATFEEGDEKQAHSYFHSTSKEAAEIARQANVQKLILTHFSARYLNKDLARLREQAQKIFPNTLTVRDLDEISIPLK